VVLVTGGSSGIGLAAAHKIAQAGAITVIVGRDQDKLDTAKGEIDAVLAEAGNPNGGEVVTLSADLASMDSCDQMVEWLVGKYGGVDVLINNAGRSIRRGVESSYDRFHDFERTMQLNYFGCLRTTMGLLPHMAAKRSGHVVNISSIGVLTNAPRFSAYVASKAALDAWTRCAASEFIDVGVTFTTINMPLVKTPMIAPTRIYDNVPTLNPEEAADLIVQAIVYRPVRIATRLGVFGQVLHAMAPRVAQIVMNTTFRMFPDSDRAKGEKEGKAKATPDQIALANLMRGVHF
ncbi:MAG: SDR family NAD(P)-dependent oxidoreductase, partial [Burkholderiales bacterium]